MSDNIRYIVADNAVTLLEKFTQAIKDGFYLSTSMEHYPTDLMFQKSIMLFRYPEAPAHKPVMGLKVKEVHCIDRLDFLVQLQQAIIEGYEPDLETLYWGVSKQVKVKPTEAAVQAEVTAKPPKVPKPPKPPKDKEKAE